jgi:recombination protein RecA
MAKSAKNKTPETPSGPTRAERFSTLEASAKRSIGITKTVQKVQRGVCLPSPSIGLNISTNEGGFRPGSIVEWFGPEGTLKTWIALQMQNSAQLFEPEKMVSYFDIEQSVDLWTAENAIGVDMGSFPDGTPKFDYFPDPTRDEIPSLEEVLNRLHIMAASGLYSLIIVDSVAALTPLIEQEKADITEAQVMGGPLLMSRAFRKLKPVCARSGTRIWFINQIRTSLIKGPGGMIAKKEPTGGYALRFAATHRYRVEWMEKERDSDTTELRILPEKVKYGPPMRPFTIPITLGHGINREQDIVIYATKYGLLTKSGSWYSYGTTQLGQGIEKTAAYLEAHPTMAVELGEIPDDMEVESEEETEDS